MTQAPRIRSRLAASDSGELMSARTIGLRPARALAAKLARHPGRIEAKAVDLIPQPQAIAETPKLPADNRIEAAQ